MDAGFEIVAEAESLGDCLLQLAQHKPPQLLMACNLLPREPIPLLTNLRQQHPNCVIVLFLANCNTLPLQAIVDAGVSGMVAKGESSQTLVQVLQGATVGKKSLSTKILATLAKGASENMHKLTQKLDLTDREVMLLTLLTQGLNNRKIAAELNLAYQTVRNDCSRLYGKLDVSNRLAAVQWARLNGLLEYPEKNQK